MPKGHADPAELEDSQIEMPKAETQIIRAEIEESKGLAPTNKQRKKKQRKKKQTKKKLNKTILNEDAPLVEPIDYTEGIKPLASK